VSRFLVGMTLLAVMLPGTRASARRQETEEELQARIQQERNPVKKAKLEIRVGRVRLRKAIAAYDGGDVSQGADLLKGYVEQMKSSWQTLQRSGRQAAHQSQGFKELDIALREDSRLLEDLAHRISYFNRASVEKTRQEIEAMRSEVLRALFPGVRPRDSEKPRTHPPGL